MRQGDQVIMTNQPGFDRNQRLATGDYELVRNLGRLLRAHPDWGRVRIDAHTDSKGREKQQLARTQTRAEAVVRILVIEGVDVRRLSIRAQGARVPIDNNRTKAGRARNNRIEITLVDPTPAQP